MSLWLGYFSDVHKRGNVILAGNLGRVKIGFEQRGIIPTANLIKFIATFALFFETRVTLKSLQNGVDTFLDHLELVGDGNAIAIIIDGNDCRRLQYTNGIDRFPEHALRSRSVTDAGKH